VATVGVGFDIDHTLCIDNKLERVAFLHLLDRLVAEGGRALGPLARESELIDELLVFQRGGGCSIEEAVRRFVSERGGEPREEYIDGFKRMALNMAETFIIPDPDAKSVLDELARRDVRSAVLSNGWNPLQTVKARRAGFHGRIIASADIRAQKPAPQAFAALAQALELEPTRCFYVGDDPKGDIAGAMAAGFRAIWLDHEGKTYPQDLPAPTHVAHSLRDVLDIVASVPAI
jgi:HAD superfamily hydrolase (TIGR01549 family)